MSEIIGDSKRKMRGSKQQPAAGGSDPPRVEHVDGAGNQFGEIGLPETAGWYVSAALYWIGGIAVLTIERIAGAEAVTPVVGVLATITLAIVPFLVLGARYLPTVWWGPYVRMLLPLFILFVGAMVLRERLGSLVLITMLPVLAVAYLHPPKISVPYCLLGAANIVGAMALYDNDPSKNARMFVLGGSLTIVTGGLIYAQQRVRNAAALNHRLSVTDPLTGLANLRRLQDRLRQEIHRSSRSGSEIVLYAIDLDDFKEVNDRFSYEFGDRVLKAVASTLNESMKPGNLLVRRGGDEFAVMTLHTPGRDLDAFRDEIAETIARARTAVCPGVNPQASVTYIEHHAGESSEDFLHRVDNSLHDAKLAVHPERRDVRAAAGLRAGDAEHPFSAGFEENQEAVSLRAPGASHARRSDNRVAWTFIIAGSIIPALLLGAVAMTGLAPDLKTRMLGICVAGSVLCALFSLFGLRRALPLRWIHLPLAATMALVTLAIASAGESRQALLELYAIQVPLVIYILSPRDVIPYAAASAFFYSYFLIAGDYPDFGVRIGIFLSAMMVLSLMLVRGQRAVREFSRNSARLSMIDPLTRVANLRGLHRRVDDEIDHCRLVGDDLALMVVDLDRFKAVNDLYNHTTGDNVLIESANAIRATVREDELVARRGGDEFTIVCVPEAHADMAAFAARVAANIERARLRLTADIPGTATVRWIFWDHYEDAEQFMRRADVELHDAKTSRDAAAPVATATVA